MGSIQNDAREVSENIGMSDLWVVNVIQNELEIMADDPGDEMSETGALSRYPSPDADNFLTIDLREATSNEPIVFHG